MNEQTNQFANGGKKALRVIRRVAVFIGGMAVLIVGVLMLVLPGPAFIFIPAGLGILAIEFVWARRWLKHARDYARKLYRQRKQSKTHGASPDSQGGEPPG